MPEEKQLNQTVPGGKYIVNGETVDAEGKSIGKAKESEKAEETETKPPVKK